MCLTCGCHLPHEDHGKKDYLVFEDLKKSAAIDNYTVDKAMQYLIETVEIAKKEGAAKK